MPIVENDELLNITTKVGNIALDIHGRLFFVAISSRGMLASWCDGKNRGGVWDILAKGHAKILHVEDTRLQLMIQIRSRAINNPPLFSRI